MLRDLHQALRMLRRTPGYGLLFLSVLAPALGAATAVFRMTDAVLLRPGVIHQQDRLAVIWGSDPRNPLIEVSYPDYLDLAAETRSFAAAAAHGSTPWTTRLTGAGDAVELPLAAVSGSLFDVLGAAPFVGRTLHAADDHPAAPRVAVIAHDLWKERFGADVSVVNRTVRLDGHPTTIVGVMPPRFDYPAGAQVWSPLPRVLDDTLSPEAKKILRRIGFLYVVARLRPDVSMAQARDEANASLQRIHARHGGFPDRRIVLTPFGDHVLGPTRPALLLMAVAVALVLVLACANAAGLVLVRAASRDREISVRRALGASPADILRLMMAEAAVLSSVACVAGLAAAWVALRAFEGLAPPALARTQRFDLDGASTGMAVAAACLAGIATGVWTARRANGPLAQLTSAGSRMTDDNTGAGRRLLIGAEVALALVVVTAAGLAARSFANLASVDLGYDVNRVLVVDLPLGDELSDAPDGGRGYVRMLASALGAVPGVETIGGVSLKPLFLGPIGDDASFQLERQTKAEARTNPWLNYLAVTPGYFEAMGIRLVSGRAFTERDVDAAERVAIVSEATARRLWGRTNVVGEKIRVFGQLPGDPLSTIVGVTVAVRHRELQQTRLDLYAPRWRVGTWMVRTAGEPAEVASSVRAAVRAAAPSQPVETTPLERLVSSARRPWGFAASVLTVFATLALVLAAAGVHALVAYAVSRRTREFGVRMALGARPIDIVRLLLRGIVGVAAIALVAGIPAALAATRLMRGLLFGVTPLDTASLAGATLVLAVVVTAACLAPARRAANVDPVVAMRAE